MANEITVKENVFQNESEMVVSTFDLSTTEGKLKAFKAINTPDHRIKDFINMEITIKDIYIESVSLQSIDEATGETTLEKAPRSIIIDDKGESYTAVSFGVFNSLKRMVEILGAPSTWEKPLKFKIKQVSKGADKNILTFEPVFK